MKADIDATTLKAFIEMELLNGQSVEPDQDLLLSGLLDSLGVMALVAFIEEQRGDVLPPEDVTLENFASIDAMLTYLADG